MKENMTRLRLNGKIVGYFTVYGNRDVGVTTFLNLRMDSILGIIRFNDQDIGFEYDDEWYFEGDKLKIQNFPAQIQKATILGTVIFDNASFGVRVDEVTQWEGYNYVSPPEVGKIMWFLNILGNKSIERLTDENHLPEIRAAIEEKDKEITELKQSEAEHLDWFITSTSVQGQSRGATRKGERQWGLKPKSHS